MTGEGEPRLVFVGAVEEGRHCLDALVASGEHFAGIVTLTEAMAAVTSGAVSFDDVAASQGATLLQVLEDMNTVAAALNSDLQDVAAALTAAVEEAKTSLAWLLENHSSDPTIPGGVSYHFLMMMGALCGGWQLARSAQVAAEKLAGGDADKDFYNAKILSAKFYAEQALPRVAAHSRSVQFGSATMMAVTLDQLRSE